MNPIHDPALNAKVKKSEKCDKNIKIFLKFTSLKNILLKNSFLLQQLRKYQKTFTL